MKDTLITQAVEPSLLSSWYESKDAQVSGFGDMNALETKVDITVRNAHEMDSTLVVPEPCLIEQIKKEWSEHLYPTDIRVEFYKMNIYGKGGKFVSHLDTPDKGLLGTALVVVGNSTTRTKRKYKWSEDPDFTLGSKEFSLKYGDLLLFFSDVEHSVLEIEEGYRATLAFKIYSTTATNEIIFPQIQSAPLKEQEEEEEKKPSAEKNPVLFHLQLADTKKHLKELLMKYKGNYGFILSHQYVRQDETFKGMDQLVIEILQELPEKKCLVFPVVTTFEGEWENSEVRENPPTCTSHVYPITESIVQKALKDKEVTSVVETPGLQFRPSSEMQEISDLQNISFYIYDQNEGYKWLYEHKDSAAYVGNNCEDGSENSIYLYFAVVVIDC